MVLKLQWVTKFSTTFTYLCDIGLTIKMTRKLAINIIQCVYFMTIVNIATKYVAKFEYSQSTRGFPHTHAKHWENVFKTNGNIKDFHGELTSVCTDTHSLSRSIVCDQSLDYFKREYALYIKKQQVETKTRFLSELPVFVAFNYSREPVYHMCEFIRQNLHHWPAKQRDSLRRRCDKIINFILRLNKISLTATVTDLFEFLNYYQNRLGKKDIGCIETIDLIDQEINKLNTFKQQYSFDECGKFGTLLGKQFTFQASKITWKNITEIGREYNIAKKRLEDFITSFLTAVVDRATEIFYLNYNRKTLEFFRCIRDCLDPKSYQSNLGRKCFVCSNKNIIWACEAMLIVYDGDDDNSAERVIIQTCG